MQTPLCKVYVCLAVTCHLHFWQNDRDLLRATAVTRGWKGYRNKSRQHRKSTLEKKILPPLLPGLKPVTFQSRVRRSNHWAIPFPMVVLRWLCTAKFPCPSSDKANHSHSCQPILGVNLNPEFVNLSFPYADRGLSFFSLAAAAFWIPTGTCGSGRKKQCCAKYTCAASDLTSSKIS